MAQFKQIGVSFDRVRVDLNENFNTVSKMISSFQGQIDKLVVEGDSSPQAAVASVGADGTVYGSLKSRLDTEQTEVATKLGYTMSQTDFDSWVATLLDGGPSIFMETYNQLVSSYPNGSVGVALVRETNPAKIYVWNNSKWEDFGDYQGIEVQDNTITTNKYVNGSVTPSKTNFLSSINLFEYGSHKINTTLNPTGVEVEGSGRSVTGFMSVKLGVTYISSGATFRIALYNLNGNFVKLAQIPQDKDSVEFVSDINGFVKISFYTESLEGFTFTQRSSFEPMGLRQKTKPFYESIDSGAIVLGEVKPSHTSFVKQGKNLFNKEKSSLNSLLRAVAPTNEVNGREYTVANYFTSEYILIKKNTTFTLSGIRAWCVYNFDKMYLDGRNTGSNNSTVTIQYPFNCLLKISGHHNQLDLAQIEEGSVATNYEPYKISIPYLSTSTVDNPLENRLSVSIGDSIALGDGNNKVGYMQLIANENNMQNTTLAISGASIGEQSDRNKITGQADSVVSSGVNYDYIVFNGGTNDSGSPLGEISEGYSAELDKSTFSGGFEYVCKTLKTNLPRAKILYIRVHNMSSRTVNSQQRIGSRAIEICKKWSIPYVDLFNEGGLNTNMQVMRDLYTIDSDGTHPNGEGYKLFYINAIKGKLELL